MTSSGSALIDNLFIYLKGRFQFLAKPLDLIAGLVGLELAANPGLLQADSVQGLVDGAFASFALTHPGLAWLIDLVRGVADLEIQKYLGNP